MIGYDERHCITHTLTVINPFVAINKISSAVNILGILIILHGQDFP